MYDASKWGLEGLSQALAQEVSGFGIHVTLIEPAGLSTDWAGPSAKRATPLPAYDEMRARAQRFRESRQSAQGDPAATAAAILEIVDAEPPPLRCLFGDTPLGIARADDEARLATWEAWQDVAVAAQGA